MSCFPLLEVGSVSLLLDVTPSKVSVVERDDSEAEGDGEEKVIEVLGNFSEVLCLKEWLVVFASSNTRRCTKSNSNWNQPIKYWNSACEYQGHKNIRCLL